jgi:hypothetical protein
MQGRQLSGRPVYIAEQNPIKQIGLKDSSIKYHQGIHMSINVDKYKKGMLYYM